ncbi:MAG TPA: DUF971 domain-containing protein [Gammaproteobacteria bacterium]|jgi:DUF971 family protein|nr:DUF971 domain-containing protein [Gammaproteobacteria bacterium]
MIPTEIKLHRKSRILEVHFDDGKMFELPAEYLRVHSPSAEVRGHGPNTAVLQIGKENVNINDIQQVGNYAVKLVFDDGHSTGLYSWDYLYELGTHQEQYWQRYLDALKQAGVERQPPANS